MKKKINIIKIFSLVLTFLVICISGFNLKVNAGYTGALFNVYSNDGSDLLFTSGDVLGSTLSVTETTFGSTTYFYTYSGDKKFIGVSTSVNATIPMYNVGDNYVINKSTTFYIVEEEINKLISLEGATVTVPVGWSASAGYGKFNFNFTDENNKIATGFYIGYYGFCVDEFILDSTEDSIYCYHNNNNFMYGDPFSLIIDGGSDVTNQNLIQWFVDNNATIIGGVYSDDVVSVTNDIGETKLVWELKWLESTEEIVSDYVEIYPSSDTKQCYIVFKKSFSIPMELVVKSEDDESLYASCDVDCYERTETVGSASLSVSLDGSTNSDLLLGQDGEENEITFNGNTSYESIFTDQKIEINSITSTISKVGTLATTQEVCYNIGLSEELQTLLEAREITFVSTTSNLTTTTIKGLLENLITFTDDNKETIYEALNTSDNWFRVEIDVIDKYHDEIINEYSYLVNIIGFVIGDYYNNVTIPTDLTGYTVTLPSGWVASGGYGMFTISGVLIFNDEEFSLTTRYGDNFFIGYNLSTSDEHANTILVYYYKSGSEYSDNYFSSHSFSISFNSDIDDIEKKQSLIQWFVDNNATFTKTLISFTIDGTSYQAEYGMTWTEWCESEYNTGTFIYSTVNDHIADDEFSQESYVSSDGTSSGKVANTDVITSGHAYSIVEVSHGGGTG